MFRLYAASYFGETHAILFYEHRAMGRENFAHCRSAEKRLLTVPNAGHGMSYMADKTAYLRAVSAFLDDVFRRKKGETGEKTQ